MRAEITGDFHLGNFRLLAKILPISTSTYYRALDLFDNPEHRAKRALHDLHHAEQIKRIWKESLGRYGVRKSLAKVET